MARVLLTGAYGQVGKELEVCLLNSEDEVISCDHRALDISQEDRVLSAVTESGADIIINAAAYTNVEKAEDERVKAYEVNAYGPKYLAKAAKLADIPLIHIPRGMGGAPDYTFFEFLQTAKVPYYLGGPILAALFNAGVKMDSIKSGNAAKMVAKHMALGVGFYYLGAIAAKAVIDNTVKAARGLDLNHPYAKVIPTSTKDTGMFKKDVELHKATESIDFTRLDLMYNKKGQTPEEINERYAKLAKKYSSGSNSSKVGVIYTKRKYLRKPPGSNLGYVTYKNEKEILVD